MAAHKIGLDYFPLVVDFFQDEKIQFISARFGMKGELVTIKLLCKIYRQGYYISWNNDIALLFAKSVGDNCQYSFVNDLVYELLKRGFFNKSIFERFSILTSNGIQSRYFEACSRRKEVCYDSRILLTDISKYSNAKEINDSNLIDNVNINDINVDINGVNVDINPQSKVKESKVKESKVKEKEKDGVDTPTPADEKKIKRKYGEYGWVMLTDTEYNRLIKEYGNAVVKHYIQYIDESAQQTGNKNTWKDWNLTVRKAIRNKWGGSFSGNFNNTEKNYDDEEDFLAR